MNAPTPGASVPRIHVSAGADKILEVVKEHGGVIIREFLNKEEIAALDHDLVKGFTTVHPGSTFDNEGFKDFHGRQTKRLTNVVTHSKVFRHNILDKDLVYEILDRVFQHDNKAYWMSAAQAIEIGPGNKAQPLHRDQGQYRVFNLWGPQAPEGVVNFLIATTRFTDENGATRFLPGSHVWPDFNVEASPEDTVPAEMEPGDCLFISGKTIHGGGSNRTEDELRRALAFTFAAAYLTPEEAYPFQISHETAKTMSKRAQRSIGFRSVFPNSGGGGLWMHDYAELADYLGMDSEIAN
jgi:ectoine hydroxylase-related dioxygenase (phytanoyl-CoA dioxygenase family)